MSNFIDINLSQKPAATSVTIMVEKGEGENEDFKERTFLGTGSACLGQNS